MNAPILARAANYAQRVWLLRHGAHASFRMHDAQYRRAVKNIDHEAALSLYCAHSDFRNNSALLVDMLLSAHPHLTHIAVDIGSGTGWLTGYLASKFAVVAAIEPSESAMSIAQRAIKADNVIWMNGLAEDMLPELRIEHPAFFVAACVLSHLTDRSVKEICRIMTVAALPGSVLCFGECWGKDSHSPLWHSRTRQWWKDTLDEWRLDFLDCYIGPGKFKGFHGVKH